MLIISNETSSLNRMYLVAEPVRLVLEVFGAYDNRHLSPDTAKNVRNMMVLPCLTPAGRPKRRQKSRYSTKILV